jgi:hypothetical protein
MRGCRTASEAAAKKEAEMNVRSNVWFVAAAAVLLAMGGGAAAQSIHAPAMEGGSGGTLNVTPLNPVVAQDQVDVAEALAARKKAQAAIDEAIRRLVREFEESPDMESAGKDLRDAQEDLAQQRDLLMARLRKNDAYRAAAERVAAAEERAEQLKAQGSEGAASAAAQQAFRLSAQTAKMERDAQQEDASYRSAKQRVMEFSRTLADRRRAFQRGLREHKDLLPLRAALDKAAAHYAEVDKRLKKDVIVYSTPQI